MKNGMIFFLIVFVVIGIWLFTPYAVSSLYPSMIEQGQFGDLYGSINALFSGLAFVGLIFTIYMQKEELALQREELRLQREEMVLSRSELANQVKVQHALFLATIGQIRVAKVQAEIESAKMQFQGHGQHHTGTFTNYIEDLAERIKEIADQIERDT